MDKKKKTMNNIIRTYAQTLENNDYQAIINLFSKDARIFSFQEGEQSPSAFFQNLFENSSRGKVEIKNVFFDVKNEKIIAAYIYLKVMWNKKDTIEFEAVDIFEFDSENKIKELKIILDTYPIRVLKKN